MNATTSCPHCNEPVVQGDRFCVHCGKSISAPAPSQSPVDQTIEILRDGTVGEYEIVKELGRGGCAVVYLAHELALGRYVAIKVMAPELLSSPDMAERFRQEAVTVANLTHPNIITIYGVRQAGQLPFFAMEFLRGRPLDVVLRETGPLSFSLVRGVLYHVGSALAYAHRYGVIHRDVKPANVLLDVDGKIVVTDFGIAKVVDEVTRLTRTGMIIGTPAYMSPEQCNGLSLTWASDQYSLGIVAYELLTGTLPFSGDPLVVMRGHADLAPPAIRDLRPDCPADVEAAVMRMLAKDPAQRWPKMSEGLTALGASPVSDGPVVEELARLAAPAAGDTLAGLPRTPRSPLPRQATPHQSNPPRSLDFTREPSSLTPGERVQLEAVPVDASGRQVPARVHWHSSAPGVVEVSSSGEILARAGGVAVVTARAGTVTRSLSISVAPAVLHPTQPVVETSTARRPRRRVAWLTAAVIAVAAGVYGSINLLGSNGAPRDPEPGDDGGVPIVAVAALVLPESVQIAVGDTTVLDVQARDSSGNAMEAPDLRIDTSDSSVVGLTASGTLIGVRGGNATVLVSSEGIESRVVVTVALEAVAVGSIRITGADSLEEGRESTLRAEVLGANGTRLLGVPVTWGADDADVLVVDRETGDVRALAPGVVRVTATAEDHSATSTIQVIAGVATLEVAPSSLTITERSTALVAVTLRDRRGGVIERRDVTWRSDDTSVARHADGEVVAVSPGQTVLMATSGDASASLVVVVEPSVAVVARVTFPDMDTVLAVDDQVQLDPAMLDANGEETGRMPDFVPDPPGIVTVDSGGLVRPLQPGAVRIIASVDGVADTISLLVAPPAARVVTFQRVVAGGDRTCGLSDARTAYCWGNGEEPTLVPNLTLRQIAVGDNHTCGVSTSGDTFCWGRNDNGQLGDGSRDNRPIPTAVDGPRFESVAAGDEHTCGVTGGGAVYCWGNNRARQIGDRSGGSSRPQPSEVTGNEPFVAVAAGGRHTCALANSGKAYCWGDGYAGQVGYGTQDEFDEPYPVAGDMVYSLLVAGEEHTCGLAEGVAYCWGANDGGQLGDGTTTDRLEPVSVATQVIFESLHAGNDHVCGLATDGVAICWGDNGSGQLGASTTSGYGPRPLDASQRFSALSAGGVHTCGLTTEGDTICWGDNNQLQLGSPGVGPIVLRIVQ